MAHGTFLIVVYSHDQQRDFVMILAITALSRPTEKEDVVALGISSLTRQVRCLKRGNVPLRYDDVVQVTRGYIDEICEPKWFTREADKHERGRHRGRPP
jgi:hypothetical protein